MAYVLPTPTDGYPNTTLRTQLDGQTYEFWWLWNQRGGAWTVTIRDAEGVDIVSGVRVVLGVDLLAGVADSRRPPGALVVTSPTNDENDPDIDTLGNSVKVIYLTQDEVSA